MVGSICGIVLSWDLLMRLVRVHSISCKSFFILWFWTNSFIRLLATSLARTYSAGFGLCWRALICCRCFLFLAKALRFSLWRLRRRDLLSLTPNSKKLLLVAGRSIFLRDIWIVSNFGKRCRGMLSPYNSGYSPFLGLS